MSERIIEVSASIQMNAAKIISACHKIDVIQNVL